MIEFARNVEAPFPAVEPNPRCIRYDCQDCQGKGYIEGWIGVDPTAIRCPGDGIIEPWLPLIIKQVRDYMRDRTSYTVVRPFPPSKQDDDSLYFNAINSEGEPVELKANRDPDVVAEKGNPTEYYFNVWERSAVSEQDWQWIGAIEAELKPKGKGVKR
ncbi:hypothetical protein [Paenibacillus sp. Y412MC10]|uniref:hypothetical protein n=1 Tax=Geobacillus sp. (strain Y412MC10) TaxID=481743 RepID=UPI0011AAFEDF|nr:hypothetical protein [Paenibacillus sp. Y412MC10]